MKQKPFIRCARTYISLSFLFIVANSAFAHGWVTSPSSRQDHCNRGSAGFNCGEVQWEPQSVEAPKGSMLCSGGSRFKILDAYHAWPVTEVGSTVTFTWKHTAAHRTLNWEYFINGQLFRTFDGGNSQPQETVDHVLTNLPAGRYTILSRWNIADTPMAFYSCMDVNVGRGSYYVSQEPHTQLTSPEEVDESSEEHYPNDGHWHPEWHNPPLVH